MWKPSEGRSVKQGVTWQANWPLDWVISQLGENNQKFTVTALQPRALYVLLLLMFIPLFLTDCWKVKGSVNLILSRDHIVDTKRSCVGWVQGKRLVSIRWCMGYYEVKNRQGFKLSGTWMWFSASWSQGGHVRWCTAVRGKCLLGEVDIRCGDTQDNERLRACC